MEHVVLDQWSRANSVIHRWDARLKLVGLLVFLISASLARTPASLWPHAGLVAGLWLATQLPPAGLALRMLWFLPLPATLAGMTWLAGDPPRATLVLAKSVISAGAVLAVAATTPLPRLMAALEALGLPRALVMTIQLIWRYLFVVAETGARMAAAARCRMGDARSRRMLARTGTGLLTALFARSHARASGVQQAMAARGYTGSFRALDTAAARTADWMLFVLAVAAAVAAGAMGR